MLNRRLRAFRVQHCSLTQAAQIGAALDGDSMLAAVALFEPNTRCLAGGRIERQHVADMDRRVLLDAAALLILPRRLHMLPDAMNSLNHHPVLAGEDAKDLTGLSLVRPGDNHHRVAAFYVSCHGASFNVCPRTKLPGSAMRSET